MGEIICYKLHQVTVSCAGHGPASKFYSVTPVAVTAWKIPPRMGAS